LNERCATQIQLHAGLNITEATTNFMVTSEIKLCQNYFSPLRRPSEIILLQRAETCLQLFQRLIAAHEYFPFQCR